MDPLVEVEGGVVIVLTSMTTVRTQITTLDRIGANNQLRHRFKWGSERWKAKKRAATVVEGGVNHNTICRSDEANQMAKSWVHKLHGVTTSYIHKRTTSGKSTGSKVRLETIKCSKKFIEIHKKRKAASFLRISVGGITSWFNSRTRRTLCAWEPNPSTNPQKKTSVSGTGQWKELYNVRVRYRVRRGVKNKYSRYKIPGERALGVKPRILSWFNLSYLTLDGSRLDYSIYILKKT